MNEPEATVGRAEAASANGGAEATEIFARIAHELRTPLTVAKGFALTVRDNAGDMDAETVRRCCDTIVRGLTTAENLVQSLAMSRFVETDQVTLDLTEGSVGEFVTETMRDLELLTDPHNVSIAILSDGVAWFDRLKLRQILTNLMSNAAKFSPPASPIDVDVRVEDDRVEVAVADRGSGIPPDRIDRLFQKWERLGSQVKGSGLGLYISRGLARAHGGDITVTSDGVNGCRFVVTLPTDPARGAEPS